MLLAAAVSSSAGSSDFIVQIQGAVVCCCAVSVMVGHPFASYRPTLRRKVLWQAVSRGRDTRTNRYLQLKFAVGGWNSIFWARVSWRKRRISKNASPHDALARSKKADRASQRLNNAIDIKQAAPTSEDMRKSIDWRRYSNGAARPL